MKQAILSSEEELNVLLSQPSPELIEFMRSLQGDLAILGVAGKMGVSLALLAKNACVSAGLKKRVIGIARFSDETAIAQLNKGGVETQKVDLSDPEQVSRLEKIENIIYMVAKKFGTDGSEETTWVMNTLVPGYVARHFKKSKIVVFSTGCVYPFTNSSEMGSRESMAPNPLGSYATSALGREMMFNYAAKEWGTPICHYRLNYSIDLRYGVLHDIAIKVLAGEVIDLSAGHFNCIWQGDANAQAIMCLGLCKSIPEIMNITGPETISTKVVAELMGDLVGKKVEFTGTPGPVYLNNSMKATEIFGYPKVSLMTMIKWQVEWLKRGNRTLGKPTKFEKTDGKY